MKAHADPRTEPKAMSFILTFAKRLGLASIGVLFTSCAHIEAMRFPITTAEIECSINEAFEENLWDSSGRFPKGKWPRDLAKHRPVRVYLHEGNAVVVESIKKGTEYGFYIPPRGRNYTPEDSEKWKFRKVEAGVWTYHREFASIYNAVVQWPYYPNS